MGIQQQIQQATINALEQLYGKSFTTKDFQINKTKPEFEGNYTIVLFSLLNLQFAKKIKANAECMFGIQNLLNFLPKDPIMRPFDPFDKAVDDPVVNPFGYTFDPSYNYAPMMKRRVVIGLRWTFN